LSIKSVYIVKILAPLVLGIGHLDGTDVPFALAVVLSSWALDTVLEPLFPDIDIDGTGR
jgi:hypothetical protein